MKRCAVLTTMAAALLVSGASAQNAPSMAAAVKQSYNQMKGLLTRAAEEMPDEGYSFQPTPAERNFGGWVAHVAESQMNTCSTIAGARKSSDAGSKTSKADLMAALKESFDACDPVFEGLTDANAADGVPSFRGQAPRLTSLFGMLSHDNECYGSMAVYLRLKEVVPPSSQRGGGPRGGPRGAKKE
ncbi:MAG: DinB family protein [Acidobacteriia bacterium]|nr:DinB family protein [Terriglobia bacterium]